MLAMYLSMLDSKEDKDSFEILYKEYVKLMYKVALDILNSQEDAEDAVSEAFVRIAKNFQIVHKFVCPKTANQFVIIVRNVSIDMYRKNKQLSENIYFDEEVLDSYFDGFEQSNLKHSIEKLNDSDKDILYLHYIYGYELNEISDLLEVSKTAVYKRLQRAKQNLKQILEEDKYD